MNKTVSRYCLAGLFLFTGILHLVRPQPFLDIMPSWVPAHAALVFWSGIAEMAGGLGLLFARTRRYAAFGLVLLLLAVFPANVQMAVNWYREVNLFYPLALLRLPLQVAMIRWALAFARKPRTARTSFSSSPVR